MEYKKMLRALSDVEEQRNISEAVILEALNEAVAKAYKKDAENRLCTVLYGTRTDDTGGEAYRAYYSGERRNHIS